MARRPFDPAAHGWTKTRYQQGDILDRGAVDALVADADVVIHLAAASKSPSRAWAPASARREWKSSLSREKACSASDSARCGSCSDAFGADERIHDRSL